MTVRLRPLFEGLEALTLPPAGVAGQLHLAASTGTEIRPALLLPPPQEIALACTDPSIARRSGVWQIYQRGPGVRVPMRLTTPVPLWAGDLRIAEDSDPDVSVEGLGDFVLLEPQRPHPFALRVNSTHWASQAAHNFKFFVNLATLGPLTLSGEIALLEGSKLLIGGPNPRLLEVQLGRSFATSFTLTASAEGAAEEDGITLVDYTVLRQSGIEADDEPDWLRLLTPARADLPLTIRPHGPERPAEQLVLEVSTGRLDRQRYAGALLRGAVELIDSRRRRWTCEVHATVTRPPRLGSPVAIDWGTTNSCAAYCVGAVGGEPPRSLSFDEEQQRAPSRSRRTCTSAIWTTRKIQSFIWATRPPGGRASTPSAACAASSASSSSSTRCSSWTSTSAATPTRSRSWSNCCWSGWSRSPRPPRARSCTRSA